MADNFNLRSFLSENKLTKNSKLLKEGSDYGYDVLMDAVEDYCDQDSPQFSKLQTAVDDAYEAGQIDTSDFGHDSRAPYKAVEEIAKESGLFDEPDRDMGWDERDDVEEGINEGSDYGFDDVMDAIANDYTPGTPEFQQMEDAVEDAFYNNQVDTSEFGHDPSAPSREMRAIAKQIGLDETTSKETVKENIMTNRDKYLTRLVENALGIQVNDSLDTEGYDTDRAEKVVGSDGVTRHIAPDESPAIDRMYDSDEYGDALANAGTNEGEESIEEVKPLPKYNSIEELMKEIEHGTNEAAHKYKMDEMKRVYEALEAKVGSLEEGEHAEHIDQKAVKQMRKDIAALRKAEEKLRKEFDKRFNKKEKAAAPKKEKEVVALQEGTFDLRKFLVENRK